MSGSSSTTRMRLVIATLVHDGWHEYRGRAESAGRATAPTSWSGCTRISAEEVIASATPRRPATGLPGAPAPEPCAPAPGYAPDRTLWELCRSSSPEPPIGWWRLLPSELHLPRYGERC